jgi:hypothetical protein
VAVLLMVVQMAVMRLLILEVEEVVVMVEELLVLVHQV